MGYHSHWDNENDKEPLPSVVENGLINVPNSIGEIHSADPALYLRLEGGKFAMQKMLDIAYITKLKVRAKSRVFKCSEEFEALKVVGVSALGAIALNKFVIPETESYISDGLNLSANTINAASRGLGTIFRSLLNN